MVLGPTSRPSHPSGMPSASVFTAVSAVSSNFEAAMKSTGKWIFTFFFLAFSRIWGTILAPSSSKRDLPIWALFKTLLKVKAIPPPIIISSTKSNMFIINWILSATLAPPMTTVRGLSGLSSTLAKYSSSFLSRKPAALVSTPTPTMEECALCAVPNASFTYSSPNRVSDALNASMAAFSAFTFWSLMTPFPSSAMWKRKFSSNISCWLEELMHAFSTSGPTQSGRKSTFFFSKSSSAGTRGLRENLSFGCPFGRPKWLMRITDLAPFFKQ
mmetsp:Transcript_4976/g.3601  ORF Transcript_4976/g.3601 Transcript_4976/m.3601 type:complete len:271 (+) Transcript_4976:341-1153(+)